MYQHRVKMASHFVQNTIWLPNIVSPVASPHKDNRKLSQDDGPSNESDYHLGALNSKTNMIIIVSNSEKNLVVSLLASQNQLLQRHNL